ncbi:hypothetical protein M0R45_027410 [Rubus argutus]|uniref:Uncharacterized protein n=1 Tax=Rubus argutus TaxID=59490 RepID=A0AAW1X2Z4_RUBAR
MCRSMTTDQDGLGDGLRMAAERDRRWSWDEAGRACFVIFGSVVVVSHGSPRLVNRSGFVIEVADEWVDDDGMSRGRARCGFVIGLVA